MFVLLAIWGNIFQLELRAVMVLIGVVERDAFREKPSARQYIAFLFIIVLSGVSIWFGMWAPQACLSGGGTSSTSTPTPTSNTSSNTVWLWLAQGSAATLSVLANIVQDDLRRVLAHYSLLREPRIHRSQESQVAQQQEGTSL